jgi:hypothetical protein
VRDVLASLVRPVKELKGFKRIGLQPGEKKRVTFIMPVDILCFAVSATTRVVEPGDFQIMIGRSSADIVFTKTVTVTGKRRELPSKWRMTTETRVAP